MKYFPWFAALVFLVAFGHANRQAGQYKERIAQLEKHSAQVDTIYVRDTVTLKKVRRVTDSLIVTDTLTFTDTVTRVIYAERRACNAVIETCEHRVAVRDSLIKVLKKKPSIVSKAPWVGIGIVIGKFLLH